MGLSDAQLCSGYFLFYIVNFRKVISICSILLVLLSSVGYLRAEAIKTIPGCPDTSTKLTEHSREELRDFKESSNIGFSRTSKVRSLNDFPAYCMVSLYVLHEVQCNCYLQKYLTVKQPRRLFIDLGAQII
jgi:hypothetical protein